MDVENVKKASEMLDDMNHLNYMKWVLAHDSAIGVKRYDDNFVVTDDSELIEGFKVLLDKKIAKIEKIIEEL